MTHRILILDQEHESRVSLVGCLSANGFEAVSSYGISKALAIADETPPDLILIVCSDASESGAEICRNLRLTTKLAETPILMLLSQPSSDATIAALDAGASHVCARSIDSGSLIANLRDLITESATAQFQTDEAATGDSEFPPVARGEIRKVESLMSSDVATVSPEDTVAEAVLLLRDCGRSCLIVCDNSRPVGVISERDLVRLLGRMLESGEPPVEKVRDFMSRRVISIRVGSTLAMANYKLAHHRIRRLPVVDSGGLLVGVLTQTDLVTAYAREVRKQSERVQREIDHRTRHLAQENARLEASARFRADFLAQMSHEIRTPMTAILGFAESIAEEELPPSKTSSAAWTIVEGGRHILDLLNDILDLSKLEAGKLELEICGVSPFGFVEEIRELISPRAVEKGLSFQLQCQGLIPTIFQTDATRLRQILLNLLGNAVKFTEAGSVTVGVEYHGEESADGSQGMLKFFVQDTGIGMSEEQMGGIFEPYTQAESSTARRFGGTGLGLSISKRLVGLLGGTISVTSELDRGSCFAVSFPVMLGSDSRLIGYEQYRADDSLQAPNRNANREDLPEIEGHILLAEDVRTNQIVIERILRKAGAQVAIASNGEIAVAMAQAYEGDEAPYDLILMDTQMPVMNGWEATKALRDWGYEGPIIGLSASATAADRDTCLEMGCNAVATKPIDRRALLEVVVSHLESRKQALRADAPAKVIEKTSDETDLDLAGLGLDSPDVSSAGLPQLSDLQFDMLGELLNLGLGRAAASLSEMTSEEVFFSLPRAEFKSPSEVRRFFEERLSQKLSGVCQGFVGTIDGSALLIFAHEKILDLISSVMSGHLPADLTSELEDDILNEVGNIILTSCISALADTLSLDIDPKVPEVIRGSCADLIERDQQEVSYVLLISIDFLLESREIRGYLTFLLDLRATESLLAALDRYLTSLGLSG